MAATYPSTDDQKLPLPSDPVVSTSLAPVPVGGASSFATTIQARLDTFEGRINLLAARIEKLSTLWGDGAISGGTISIGIGLSVDIAALEAIVGTYLEKSDEVTVGGLEPNATNRLWLRQTGEFTPSLSDTAPSEVDGKGRAFLWGTATTGTSTVTSVSNTRRFHAQNRSQIYTTASEPAVLKESDLYRRTDTNVTKAIIAAAPVTIG